MTKIKNTKKGMAKKTLSISLAVAMLATSNVPVWAAEFTDGTDAAFTSEAPAEVVDEAPVVDNENATDATSVSGTIKLPETVTYDNITSTSDVKLSDNKPYPHYLNWYVTDEKPNWTTESTYDEIYGSNAEKKSQKFTESNAIVTGSLEGNTDYIGKYVTAVIYREETTGNYTVDKVSNSAKVYYGDEKTDYYTGNVTVDDNVTKVKTGTPLPTYTSTLKGTDYSTVVVTGWYDPNGKLVEKIDGKYYASVDGTYTLKAVVTPKDGTDSFEVRTPTVTASKHIDEDAIVGSVSISNKADNQWGYTAKAEFDSVIPEGVTLSYRWEVKGADEDKWTTVKTGKGFTEADIDANEAIDNTYVMKEKDCGKQLQVVAVFHDTKQDEVIVEKTSNSYEVAPLKIAEEGITYSAPENFGLTKENETPSVNEVQVENKDVDDTTIKWPDTLTNKEYELVAQNTNVPGVRTVTIKLKGSYEGERTITVNVNGFSLADCDVTLESKYVPFVGDGQYAAPVIEKVVWANREELVKGEDYVIDKDSLKDNIEAGEHSLILKGIGDFTGSELEVKYEIVARSMENVTVKWTGKPVVKGEDLVAGVDVKDSKKTHFVVVDQKGYVLVPGKDYTFGKDGIWDVSNQKCKVAIAAKGSYEDKANSVWRGGNYYGKAESDFTTVGRNIEVALTNYVESVVSAQTYTGKEITFKELNKISKDAVKAANPGMNDVGFTDDLEVGVDFDITYLNNKDAYLLKDADGELLKHSTGVDGKTYYFTQNVVDSDVENDDPQAPQVYLTFKGKFSGKTTPVRFAINQAAIKDVTQTGSVIFDPMATDTNANSDYADQIKALNLIDANKNTLVNTVDYTYDYYYVNDKKDVSTENGVFKYEATAHTSKVLNGKEQITVYDGNYYGSFAKEVDVVARSLKVDSITVADIENQKYTGKLVEPKVTVKDGSYTLVEGVDYKLTYKNNRSAGTATVYINGLNEKGRYTDTISKTFTIENKSIADAKILREGAYVSSYKDLSKYTEADYKIKNVQWNNDREVEAKFDVVDSNNNLLRLGYDYTVQYKDNTKVGTATIIITGKGDYEGTIEGSFEILGKAISGHFVEDRIPAQTYTGSAIEPEVTFVPDTPNLVEGKDYEIVYEYNVEPGKGDASDINNKGPKAVAQGIGNYAGAVKLGFEIKKSDITIANVTAEDATYAGGKIAESKITVINPAGGAALEEGKDYSVEYVSGTNVGETGKAVLHLLNNKCLTFSGDDSDNATITVTYDIVAKDLKDVTVDTIEDQTATGEELKPTLVVRNGSVVMTEGVDYEVTYKDNKEVGVGSATITPVAGNKNYTGSKEVTFNIVAAKPEVEKAIISEVKVSGNTVTPVLSGDVEGAVGYDYVLATEEDYKNGRVDISKNILNTHTNFYYVPEGTYYVYCHAWKRDAETNKKIFGAWSNIEKVEVTATTPSTPKILKTSVKGNTVTVTYTKSEGATGYDVILGSEVKKVNGEYRPVNFNDLVVKNIKGNVYKATFKNVPEGKYYAGLHSFNRTSEDGKKVFSKWSNRKTVTVR